MKKTLAKPETIPQYIAQFPSDVQAKLRKIRAAIRKAVPKAKETIKYGIPAYELAGNVIYFSAWKKHISIYPRVKALAKELSAYPGAKGTIQISYEAPLPLTLIAKLARHRVRENLRAAREKKEKALTRKKL